MINFLIDYKNKVQLVYPNFQNHMIIIEIRKLIIHKLGFEERENYLNYKMIWCKDFRHEVRHSLSSKAQSMNYLQSIKHLKAALNIHEIDEYDTFSLYKDEEDSILYISRLDSPVIQQIYIKDLACEEAYH